MRRLRRIDGPIRASSPALDFRRDAPYLGVRTASNRLHDLIELPELGTPLGETRWFAS
jgi:hypothetical protein